MVHDLPGILSPFADTAGLGRCRVPGFHGCLSAEVSRGCGETGLQAHELASRVAWVDFSLSRYGRQCGRATAV